MEIKVKNFGPIKSANLSITPITIIIGRNNLGKSFLSQLIYSIISSLGSARRRYIHEGGSRVGLQDLPPDYVAEEISGKEEIKKATKLFKDNEITKEQFVQSVIDSTCKLYSTLLDRILSDQLERTFGISTKELVRLGTNKSTVTVKTSSTSQFFITIGKNGAVSTELIIDKEKLLKKLINDKSILISIESISTHAKLLRQLKNIIVIFISDLNLSPDLTTSYYLPAGRGGLMDSWETISSAWINLAPVSIPRGISMPPLPGTSAMFYNILQSLSDDSKGQFYNLRDNFNKLLNGDLIVSIDKNLRGKRNIEYIINIGGKTKKINIIHAASMIKELGPLYLIIREVLRSKDLFIVEEPESHLHPTAQRDFSRILVELSARGVNCLITTHSDIMLRSLAHFVYQNSKEKDSNEKISLSKLSIFLIKDSNQGSVSQKIIVSKRGSISKLPTFDQVIEELYDEEMRLEIL
jgi:predicted ATPase